MITKKIVYSLAVLSLSCSAASIVAAADGDNKAGIDVSAAAAKKQLGPTWAYQPINSPAIPAVKQKQWVRTPIDAFVLAKQEESGLKPSKDADRAVFIRRATLDAWGLLPTPEEVNAFVNDKSANAYEKLVDRLLASPHFGERQARRWLDLARYADTTGFQNDSVRPNNWRYRDYVIKAFNENKPYSQFVQEQIAGDELWPERQEARIATGFLAGYTDNYNSRDLIQRKYEIEVDMANTVGEAFLGTTVGCAQCHNHKSDKISSTEYFQLLSFFANTAFDPTIPITRETETKWDVKYREEKQKYDEAIKDVVAKQKAILDTVRAEGEKYYKERYLTDSRESVFKPESEWTPLDRWVNFRYKTYASGEGSIIAYLRMTAEQKDHPQYSEANVAKWAEFQKLTAELRKFSKLQPKSGSLYLTSATELGHPDAPPTFLRFSGIHERPLDEVQPGIPALLGGDKLGEIKPTATSSGRRSALANWIVGPNNPLTARVYVNRVWGQYFDKPFVVTPDNFGRSGGKPTHPELLDYLASRFKKDWDVKSLHREILLSSVYRQSSEERPDVAKADPANNLLAVYPRKRLEAEQIRDSLLYASGQFVDEVGGPAVYPPLIEFLARGRGGSIDARTTAAAALAYDADRNSSKTTDAKADADAKAREEAAAVANSRRRVDTRWPVSEDKRDWNRRSIYTFVRRGLPYPIINTFDAANPSLAYHKRDVTTTPLQALTLFNSDVAVDWSQALAGRLINEAGANPDAVLNRLYEVLFARKPSKAEVATLKDFLNKEEQSIALQLKESNGQFDVATPVGLKSTPANANLSQARLAAWVDLVHTVANSNEFVYRF
ncbi:MAG: DUF1549 and DUF1553 domain-containing protein [Zoogloeaceae bacterium]|nr:DUF1549 and DUF1553 domain-containing protein [Zoogloeaceae bacterium]